MSKLGPFRILVVSSTTLTAAAILGSDISIRGELPLSGKACPFAACSSFLVSFSWHPWAADSNKIIDAGTLGLMQAFCLTDARWNHFQL
jgi:hypothetical protein